MNKTGIEYVDMTWNPITGCLHGCPYCYAKDRVKRFQGYDLEGEITTHNPHGGLAVLNNPLTITSKYGKTRRAAFPYGFDPTLHMYRLDEPASKKSPETIFVCSMSDLFGDWIPDEWIEKVFNACAAAPWHRYLFLTKNPKRYLKLDEQGKLPPGYWYGTTLTTQDQLTFRANHHYTFVSIEPIHGDFPLDFIGQMRAGLFPKHMRKVNDTKWIIIGAETGNREGKVKPERKWIENIVSTARKANIPIFMKSSISPYWDGALIRELPWEVKK